MEKKIAVIDMDRIMTLSALTIAEMASSKRENTFVLVDNKPKLPELPTVQPFHPYLNLKPKKDKSQVKRYSSYFNKKKP